MNAQEFAKKLMERAAELGFDNLEVYFESDEAIETRVHNQQLDVYTVSNVQGVAVRGKHNGKMGTAYTERLDEEALDPLLESAKQNAEIIEQQTEVPLLDDGNPIIVTNDASFPTAEEITAWIKRLEQKAVSLDPKVTKANFCRITVKRSTKSIRNSLGLQRAAESFQMFAALSVIAKEGNDVKTGGCFKKIDELSDEMIEEIAHKAVQEAVSQLGATSMKSGSYSVILRNNVARSLLGIYFTAFSAEQVQKGLSFYGDKKGTKVARESISIIDDPALADAPIQQPFDGEGAATSRKLVINQGTLECFLYDLKAAYKDGVSTTGNANRPSYKSGIDIAPSNFYIENGAVTFDQLLEQMGDGVVITEVQGTHSGTNRVSGDFSLSAHGFYVENGKVAKPIHQITVSGNFFEMLSEVEELADDLEFSFPTGRGAFASPSLLIPSLSIAGE